MSKRRPFSTNYTTDFISFYSNKNALTNYQFARNHSSAQNNTINRSFSMTDCNSKQIINYKSYDTYINLSKIAALLDPSLNTCIDVPLNLNNGIKSEIHYNDLYENNDKNCEYIKIPIINNCSEKTGKLFPYGNYTNPIKNPAIKIQSLKNINCNCNEKKECHLHSYILCQCSPSIDNCECCEFTTITPFDAKTNIVYTDNNSLEDCTINNLEGLLPYQQDYMLQLQKMKINKLQEDKILTEKAFTIYSKFGNRS